MIGKLFGLMFNSSGGRIASAIAACVAFLGWFAWDQRHTGALNERTAKLETEVAAASASQDAADRVPDDGRSFERLRQLYCGDC